MSSLNGADGSSSEPLQEVEREQLTEARLHLQVPDAQIVATHGEHHHYFSLSFLVGKAERELIF